MILGSFPSVASRKSGFFYMHPTNRFYKTLGALFKEEEPLGTKDRKAFLTRHGIALYDVVESCLVRGSSDSSIKEARPSDLRAILSACQTVKAIFVTGQKAYTLYRRYFSEPAFVLPSPSAANASSSLADLVRAYGKILAFL